MKNIITIMLGMLLLISIVGAEVISIEPEVLEPLSMYGGETITQEITIYTDRDYLVYLDYNITNNTYDEEGFLINLPQWIFVEEEKTFEIEISTIYNFMPDNFTITFKATTTGSEIENSSSNNYDNTTGKIDTGMGIELEINSTGNGTVDVYKVSNKLDANFRIPSLNIFFHIEASDSIEEGMNETEIKVSYSQDEVDALGIDENELRLYFYNETLNDWIIINSWVDTTNNIVYGITDHFSLWGVFGNLIPEQQFSQGGGGRRRVYIENKTIEYIVNETCEEESCTIEDIKPTDYDGEIIITPEEKSFTWLYVFLIVCGISVAVLFYKEFKKKDEDTSEDVTTTK